MCTGRVASGMPWDFDVMHPRSACVGRTLQGLLPMYLLSISFSAFTMSPTSPKLTKP